jgi:hypothetical protein
MSNPASSESPRVIISWWVPCSIEFSQVAQGQFDEPGAASEAGFWTEQPPFERSIEQTNMSAIY